MKCNACGRSVRNVISLFAIGSRCYCNNCLKKIRVKKTGKRVKYYANIGERLFVRTWERGVIIEEYHIKELRIG